MSDQPCAPDSGSRSDMGPEVSFSFTQVSRGMVFLDSCLRLVSALLGEQDTQWITAQIYLAMKSSRSNIHANR